MGVYLSKKEVVEWEETKCTLYLCIEPSHIGGSTGRCVYHCEEFGHGHCVEDKCNEKGSSHSDRNLCESHCQEPNHGHCIEYNCSSLSHGDFCNFHCQEPNHGHCTSERCSNRPEIGGVGTSCIACSKESYRIWWGPFN